MPFKNRNLLSKKKNYFIAEIQKSKKLGFNKYFNLNKMINSIKNNYYLEDEEWFLLRILCLIVNSNFYGIQIK